MTDELTVDKMTVNKLIVDKITVSKLIVDQMTVYKMTLCHFKTEPVFLQPRPEGSCPASSS